MKRINLYLIGVICAIVLCVIMVCFRVNSLINSDNKKEEKIVEHSNKPINKKSEYKTYKVGYHNMESEVIITSNVELAEYASKNADYYYDGEGNAIASNLDKFVKDYDEDFFKDYNLAVIYIPTSSGSISIDNVSVEEKNNTVEVSYNLKMPEVGTADMNGILLTIKINKNINSINIR